MPCEQVLAGRKDSIDSNQKLGSGGEERLLPALPKHIFGAILS
jgi:hypothetical protein